MGSRFPDIAGILFLDAVVSRLHGVLKLVRFIVWLAAAIVEARRLRSATEQVLGPLRRQP